MKLIVRSGFDEDEGRARLKLLLGGAKLEFLDGEPEDANLGRDFNDCYAIATIIKEVHAAGLRGEQLEVEEIEDDDIFGENW